MKNLDSSLLPHAGRHSALSMCVLPVPTLPINTRSSRRSRKTSDSRSSMSVYLATVLRLSRSLRAISARGTPLRVHRAYIISRIQEHGHLLHPSRVVSPKHAPGTTIRRGRVPGPRGRGPHVETAHFSVHALLRSRCSIGPVHIALQYRVALLRLRKRVELLQHTAGSSCAQFLLRGHAALLPADEVVRAELTQLRRNLFRPPELFDRTCVLSR